MCIPIPNARGKQEEEGGEGFRVVPSPCAVGFEPSSSSLKSAERVSASALFKFEQPIIDLANEGSDSTLPMNGDSGSRCQPIIGMVRSEPQTAAPGTLNTLPPTKLGSLKPNPNLTLHPEPQTRARTPTLTPTLTLTLTLTPTPEP